MNIGFLSQQIDARGTGNALYNYAHYNEEILGNKSSIYTLASSFDRHDTGALDYFKKRFGYINYISDGFSKLDALYHIKSGYNDGFNPGLPYLVHSVFDNEPHGTVYATVSPWMGTCFNLPFVPHVVDCFPTNDNLRNELGIPSGAVVFGRYGGADSFDIPWVWDVINDVLLERNNVYFIFMNTNYPDEFINEWIGLEFNIRFLNSTVDPYEKRRFINTCDAFLHARQRGETFGLSVGEFAIAGKPIITYSESPEKAHLQELGPFALTYKNEFTLKQQLDKVMAGPLVSWGYGQYTPENVMKKFKQVFLEGL